MTTISAPPRSTLLLKPEFFDLVFTPPSHVHNGWELEVKIEAREVHPRQTVAYAVFFVISETEGRGGYTDVVVNCGEIIKLLETDRFGYLNVRLSRHWDPKTRKGAHLCSLADPSPQVGNMGIWDSHKTIFKLVYRWIGAP